MLQAIIVFYSPVFLLLQSAVVPGEGRDPDRFLDEARIVETRPEEGEVRFVDPDGKSYRLQVGDMLDEARGATLKKVRRSTLVLTRPVTGGDGQRGEALIVVRFDSSGKTTVREYWTVPAVPAPALPKGKRPQL